MKNIESAAQAALLARASQVRAPLLKFLMALVLALLINSHALAQSSWSGFYAGLNAGYAWQSHPTFTGFSPNDRIASISTCGGLVGGTCAQPMSYGGGQGATWGGQLGYNWQFNPAWVLGMEVDFAASSIKGSGVNQTFLLAGGSSQFRDSRALDWFGTVRGRVGFLPMQALMIYGTGGFAYGRTNENTALDSQPGPNVTSAIPPFYSFHCLNGPDCFVGRSSNIVVGWTAGAGVEYRVWQNVSLKAEYLHASLSDGSATNVVAQEIVSPLGKLPSSFTAHRNSMDIDLARIGVNIKLTN